MFKTQKICLTCQKLYEPSNQTIKFCSKNCYYKFQRTLRGEKTNRFVHGMCTSDFYIKWKSLKQRCYDKGHHKFPRYGGRGIKCLWVSFQEFKKDMYESYQKHIKKFGRENTQIERIDNDGDYSKENCRWATRKEQANNRSSNIIVEYNGVKKNLKQWAEHLGINYMTLHQRVVKRKWPTEKCFEKKIYSWRVFHK